jgi:NAD(P)-dependent dehydrogenase (short-subunit alcohol dehydrogenase family)
MPDRDARSTGTLSGAQTGAGLYAGMRDIAGRNAPAAQEAADYASRHSVDLQPREMDVSEQASVDAAVQTIISTDARLDVIVHNAGHMVLGRAADFVTDHETNYGRPALEAPTNGPRLRVVM